MWWMPCLSVSNTPKSKVLRSEMPLGGSSLERRFSHHGMTPLRTEWPLTSSTSRSYAGSSSESTAVTGYSFRPRSQVCVKAKREKYREKLDSLFSRYPPFSLSSADYPGWSGRTRLSAVLCGLRLGDPGWTSSQPDSFLRPRPGNQFGQVSGEMGPLYHGGSQKGVWPLRI